MVSAGESYPKQSRQCLSISAESVLFLRGCKGEGWKKPSELYEDPLFAHKVVSWRQTRTRLSGRAAL